MPQSITEEDVRRVAKLSRLELSDEQVRAYTGQLAHVLEYISKLNELDVADVEPMAHAMDMSNVLREDVVREPLPVQVALANAPQAAEPYFRVPKVLGEAGGA
jgi:aspartyl-tRNA(Asn)/glutamyl-tRNA(Gln) amidotransferase subunit C